MIKPTTGQRTIGLLGLLTAHLALVAPAAAQNLHVAGKIGVGTTSPSLPLHVATCGQQAGCVAGDVSLSGGGYALFGNQSGVNLALDNNEIMSRSAGQPSSLYVNKDGGDIRLNLISGTTIVGDASTSRNRPLWVQGGNNIHLTDFNTGFIQAGANNGPNLVIDTNEIMARNNSGPLATGAPLYLNYYPGGQVRMMMPILISSDVRLKTSIAPISSALERLRRLRGVTWRWKAAPDVPRSMGVIAQEVERVFPELVSADPGTGTRSVQYEGLIAPLIEAVKELEHRNEALRADVEALRRRLDRSGQSR